MNNRVCDKYYVAQTRGEAKKLGVKVAHFCSLQKGHGGPHMCPGRRMHDPKMGGMHETPLHFDLQTPPVLRNLRATVPRVAYR